MLTVNLRGPEYVSEYIMEVEMVKNIFAIKLVQFYKAQISDAKRLIKGTESMMGRSKEFDEWKIIKLRQIERHKEQLSYYRHDLKKNPYISNIITV